MAVSYSKEIITSVTRTIFDRGREYFRKGKVRNLVIGKETVLAVVSGNEDYDVEVGFAKNCFGADCSCPYMENNQNDYCKHIVAVAIARDKKLGLPLPSNDELESLTIEEFPHLGQKLNNAFKDPLKADLVAIARATDFGSWVRPHAKIGIIPYIFSRDVINISAVKKAFRKVGSLSRKYKYDMYFCAGEVTAVTAATLDEILFIFPSLEEKLQKDIFYETIKFYYQIYLNMIDGSDGVWQIVQARVKKMATLGDFSSLKDKLNKEITGWGDVFEDLV